MFPSCFSQPNTKSIISHNHDDHEQQQYENNKTNIIIQNPNNSNQNLITCIYQTELCNSPTYLTLTWSKTLVSHTLTIHSSQNLFATTTISLQQSTTLFSIFFRPKQSKPSSKSIPLITHHHCKKIKLYWDFTRAEFAHNSAEPESRFYLAIVTPCNDYNIDFFLGDLHGDLTRRSGITTTTTTNDSSSTRRGAIRLCGSADPRPNRHQLLSRRDHVFGRRNYTSRGVFAGARREMGIECNAGTLKVRVDGELRLVVKRLAWKFRGNEKIFVGGVEVDFFWDVFNWVSGDNGDGDQNGHGVFIFQVGDGGVWPEMVGPERRLMKKSLSTSAGSNTLLLHKTRDNNNNNNNVNNNNGNYCYNNNNNYYYNSCSTGLSNSPSWSSVLQWTEESSDGGSRSSCSSSTRSSNYVGNNGGFSLLIYAWRKA